MHRRLRTASFSCCCAIVFPLVSLFGLTAAAQIEYREVPGQKEFTGEMIVRPVPVSEWVSHGLTPREARDRHGEARQALERYERVEYVSQTDETILRVPPGATENDVARELLGSGLFRYAEPNWLVFPIGCPNDSRFGSQWHHDANRMQSCDGWDIETGDPSVTVAICDTGIRVSHEDFQLHRKEGYNAVDRRWESQGGDISPVHPHGTNTTGCAAANGNNSVGIAGVGWDLGHRMMRVSNSSGGGATLGDLQHAARTGIEAGDRVASVSYSGVDASSNLSTATYIKSIDGLMVWAAGNDGRFLTLSSRDRDDLIVAGGTDSGDNKAGFSAYGPMVDVVAPAVGVYTTDSGHDSDYASVSGTSFACPLTAGLAALIWAADPTLSPDEVEQLLKLGCDDLGTTGIDDTYGYGRINVNGSLIYTLGGDPPLPSSGVLFSMQADGSVGGLSVARGDLIHLDPSSGVFSRIFDASDVLPVDTNVDAATVLADGSLVLSFNKRLDVPAMTGGPLGILVRDEDLVRFHPLAWGDDTLGTFSFYFDGSDVSLGNKREDVDAVSVDAAGNLYLSNRARYDVGAFSGRDEDVFRFVPTSLGAVTSGSYEQVFNGSSSDVQLDSRGEDVDGFHWHQGTGDLYLTTVGGFDVPPALTGQDDDLLLFVPTLLGPLTEGSFSLWLDGAAYGLDPHDIDALHILEG